MKTRPILGALALIVGVASPPVVLAYATPVHADFWALAFGDRTTVSIQRPQAPAELSSLRTKLYARAAKNPAFKQKYPNATSFDERAFKEFLALNPERPVWGIDAVGPGSGAATNEEALGRMGSVAPDDDTRNQDRMLVEGGKIALDPYGRAVPYDPRTTWFGGLTGTPSQFDAHGATVRSGEYGDGIIHAFKHPERWARPPQPMGSAPEFSQLYTDLALAAKLDGGANAEWMAIQFAGNAFHGIEDLGNQIHTTVIGIPEFFLDAKLTYYKGKISSFFHKKKKAAASAGAPTSLTPDEVREATNKIQTGRENEVDPKILYALGKEAQGTLTDTDIGIRIIGNHHRLLEDFFDAEYRSGLAKIKAGQEAQARPEVRNVYHRALAGDKDFENKCRAALKAAGLGTKKPGEVEFAKIIAEQMVEASSPEAAPIYRAIRKISKKELKRDGTYPADVAGTTPAQWMTTQKDEHTDLIFELHAKAFARVVTALRLWREIFDAEVKAGQTEGEAASDRLANRIATTQLDYLAKAKARRDQYLADKKAEWAKEHPTSGLLNPIKNP